MEDSSQDGAGDAQEHRRAGCFTCDGGSCAREQGDGSLTCDRTTAG
jgi:hypothetical protein